MLRLLDTREEQVPVTMVLRRFSSRATKFAVKHLQLMDVVDRESLPAVRRAAAALSADLIREQALDTFADAIVVRLGDPRSSGLVDELDQMLPADRLHEILIHISDASRTCRSREDEAVVRTVELRRRSPAGTRSRAA